MILIFESHPIQYKAPVYQRLQQLRPNSFRVIYGTDSSMRDGFDPEFGRQVTWDTPLLDGYSHTVLKNQTGPALGGFRSLSGRGVFALLRQVRPQAVLLAPFLYEFDVKVFLSCLLLRIPIWIRTETQDEAFVRSRWRTDVRKAVYWLAYKFVAHAFYIGALNREHLLQQGLPPEKMSFAPYASPLAIPSDLPTRQRLRDELRGRLGLAPDDIVVLFSGKLIEKKNPAWSWSPWACFPPISRNESTSSLSVRARWNRRCARKPRSFPAESTSPASSTNRNCPPIISPPTSWS